MASLTRMPRATAHACGQPHWSAVLQQGPTLEATWGQSGPSGRRTQSLRCHPSTVPLGILPGCPIHLLSSTQQRQQKRGEVVTQHLPSLPPSLMHMHTYTCPHPGSQVPPLLQPSPKHKAQPSCQLFQPTLGKPHGMQQMLSAKYQEKYPSRWCVGLSLGCLYGAQGKGWRVRSVGLPADVATSICRHMPRGRGPRILHTADAGRCWCPPEPLLS